MEIENIGDDSPTAPRSPTFRPGPLDPHYPGGTLHVEGTGMFRPRVFGRKMLKTRILFSADFP